MRVTKNLRVTCEKKSRAICAQPFTSLWPDHFQIASAPLLGGLVWGIGGRGGGYLWGGG